MDYCPLEQHHKIENHKIEKKRKKIALWWLRTHKELLMGN
jgi:hypothetical protein